MGSRLDAQSTATDMDSRLDRVADILNVPQVWIASAHPAREDFLIASTESGALEILHVDPRSGATSVIAPSGTSIKGPVAIHPEKPLVAFGRDEGGDEQYGIHCSSLDGEIDRGLSAGPLGRVNGLCWLDGDHLLVLGNDEDEVYLKILALDGKSTTLVSSQRQMMQFAVDSSRGLAVVSQGRGPQTELVAVSTEGRGETKTLLGGNGEEPMHPCIEPESGQLFYFAGTQLVRFDLELAREMSRVEAPGEVELLGPAPRFGPDGSLYAVLSKDAELRAYRFEPEHDRWSSPLSLLAVGSMSMTLRGPVWSASDFGTSPRIEGLVDQKPVTLHQPGRQRDRAARASSVGSSAPAAAGFEVENLRFASFDGLEVQGWLLRSGNADAPLIVYPHGGPSYSTRRGWDPFATIFVQSGYHVFAPNYRGSTGFGSEFQDLLMGDAGGPEVLDCLYGARYALERLGLSGKDRTTRANSRPLPAILGGSYGGYLTLMALCTQPEAWAGGVAFVPIADWKAAFEDGDAHYRQFSEHFMGGTPEELPERYRERSPSSHLSALRAPLLIVHGENDSRCPIGPVRAFVERAKAKGLPVRLEAVAGEGHGSVDREQRIREMGMALEHLERIFGGPA